MKKTEIKKVLERKLKASRAGMKRVKLDKEQTAFEWGYQTGIIFVARSLTVKIDENIGREKQIKGRD